jgi:hypothetical protein
MESIVNAVDVIVKNNIDLRTKVQAVGISVKTLAYCVYNYLRYDVRYDEEVNDIIVALLDKVKESTDVKYI